MGGRKRKRKLSNLERIGNWLSLILVLGAGGAAGVGGGFGGRGVWGERGANVEAGWWYLGGGMGRWPEREAELRVALGLAEYNAGFGNALRWLPRGREVTAEEFVGGITFPT